MKMTWKELKDKAEESGVLDADDIDIMGAYSKGSFGSVEKTILETRQTPLGPYREFQLFIRA